MRFTSAVLCFGFCAGVLFTAAAPVLAGPTKFVPSVAVREEYRDNVLFSYTNEKDDFITLLKGGLALEHRGETTTANLSGRLNQSWYQDNDALDGLNKYVSGDIQSRVSERLTLGSSASWQNEELRGDDAEGSGFVLTGDKESINAGVNGSLMVSEISQISTSVSYGTTDLEDTDELEETEFISANLQFSKNLSEYFDRTTGLLSLSYQQYSSENQNPAGTTFQDYDTDIWQLTVGFSRQITELYSYSIQAGLGYSDTEETQTIRSGAASATTVYDDDSFNGVLSASLDYAGETTDASLTVSHDVRGGTGTSGATERSSVGLGLTRRLTEHLALTLDTSWYWNRNERNTSADTDQMTVNIAPGFRWNMGYDFVLRGGYRYTWIDDREGSRSRERNLFFVELTKEFNIDLN